MTDTPLNSTVGDAVGALNALFSDGEAASAPLVKAWEQAAALAMLNAVQAQQADAILADAALARIAARLLALSPMAGNPPPPEPAP